MNKKDFTKRLCVLLFYFMLLSIEEQIEFINDLKKECE